MYSYYIVKNFLYVVFYFLFYVIQIEEWSKHIERLHVELYRYIHAYNHSILISHTFSSGIAAIWHHYKGLNFPIHRYRVHNITPLFHQPYVLVLISKCFKEYKISSCQVGYIFCGICSCQSVCKVWWNATQFAKKDINFISI